NVPVTRILPEPRPRLPPVGAGIIRHTHPARNRQVGKAAGKSAFSVNAYADACEFPHAVFARIFVLVPDRMVGSLGCLRTAGQANADAAVEAVGARAKARLGALPVASNRYDSLRLVVVDQRSVDRHVRV